MGGLRARLPHPPDPGLRRRRPRRGPGAGRVRGLGLAARGDQAEGSGKSTPGSLWGGAPALFTALPRAGEGTWLGEGAINICK